MPNGYAGKFLRVDLTEGEIYKEKLDERICKNYLGGVGIGSYILYKEIPAEADPLSPWNEIILFTGPLTGTRVPAGGHVTLAKSPLTGTVGWSSPGGNWGAELKYAGYDGLVVKGKSEDPVYLWIDDEFVEIKSARNLWGLTTGETEKLVKRELGDVDVKVISIGPAGERLVRYASVVSDGGWACGRCGMGAVMGSKKLKAIAVRGNYDVNVARMDELKGLIGKVYERWKSDPFAKSLNLHGTASMVSLTSEIGSFPTKNFQGGWFPEWEKISGQAFANMQVGKRACLGCLIACGRITRIGSGPYEGRWIPRPEYEHINAFGALCGNADPNSIATCHHLCNQYGLDGVSCGATIAFSMECYERGILMAEITDGLDLSWGNRETMVELVKRIGERKGIGDTLDEGSRIAAQRMGKGAEKYSIQTKGLECAGYDLRRMKGMALACAVGCPPTPGMLFVDLRVPTGMCPIRPLDPHKLDEERVRIQIELERRYRVISSSVLCELLAGVLLTPDLLASLLSAVTGWDFEAGQIDSIGERILNLQRLYNTREEMARKDDSLPERFFEEPLREGPSKGHVIDRSAFEKALDAYYFLHGWDEHGIPTGKRMKELDLKI